MVKGYKVFNSDWTCMNKQYTCPGKFEEDVEILVCHRGMHFCKNAIDCFNYYSFNPGNHIAEVIAYGNVVESGDKCCTDKLEIVREIPWQELLEIVNTGKGCTGYRNSGDRNSGDRNSGYRNSGDWNSGYRNSGKHNSGKHNSGDWNSGNCNSGDYNSGYRNSGYRNSGKHNSGNHNSGNFNSGNCNSGNCNSGDYNSGDWNKTDFSSGCFNTVEAKIYLFNKPSDWTLRDWWNSEARHLLNKIEHNVLEWVVSDNMTDKEKEQHPEYETTGGYLKKLDETECVINWWQGLSNKQKGIITAIPNFDKEIFKEIMGIDVECQQ